MVEVEIFALAVVGAQADDVALGTDDGDERELAEESADGGVALAHPLASLDRKGYVVAVAEIETQHGVRDPGRAPVIEEEVEAAEIVEIDLLSLPLAGVVELSAIVAIAKIVNGNDVAVDFGPCGSRDIRLPVRVIGGLQRQPPQHYDQRAGYAAGDVFPEALKENEGSNEGKQVDSDAWNSQPRNANVEIESGDGPEDENEQDDADEEVSAAAEEYT